MDRRQSARYELRVPVLFHWADGHTAGGFSRDLSQAGAYVVCETDDCPERGVALALEVWLPSLQAETQGLKLKLRGIVVRTCGASEPAGFAVRTELSAGMNDGESEQSLSLQKR